MAIAAGLLCLPGDGFFFRLFGQAKRAQPLEFGVGRQLGLPLFGEDGLIAPAQLGKACFAALPRFPSLCLVSHRV